MTSPWRTLSNNNTVSGSLTAAQTYMFYHYGEKLRIAIVCIVRTWLVPLSRPTQYPPVFLVGQSPSGTRSPTHVTTKERVDVDARAVVRHAIINAQGVRHETRTYIQKRHSLLSQHRRSKMGAITFHKLHRGLLG